MRMRMTRMNTLEWIGKDLSMCRIFLVLFPPLQLLKKEFSNFRILVQNEFECVRVERTSHDEETHGEWAVIILHFMVKTPRKN